jgi:hypothetical protein
LTLSEPERRLCELHYHGHWSAERLARDARVDGASMRKRLQRIRDKLRKEIEMDERAQLGRRSLPHGLPANITELLARPRLVHLPDNPVGAVSEQFRAAFAGFSEIELPEEIDLTVARKRLGGDAVYIDPSQLHRILDAGWSGAPQRRWAAGKVYRRETESATRLEAFHQLELFAIDTRDALEAWGFAARILDAVDRVLPRSEVWVSPTDYPMCARAWSLDVLRDDQWLEILAWGEYADWVLRGLGADPARHRALGAGLGLERLASLKFAIDDIRKIAATSVA